MNVAPALKIGAIGETSNWPRDAHSSSVSCNTANISKPILLITAKVQVRTIEGRTAPAHTLLDPRSETTFITESLAQAFREKR